MNELTGGGNMQDVRTIRPTVPEPPAWLVTLGLALVALSATQISYAVNTIHGPYIALCDVCAAFLFGVWLLARGQYWRQLRRPPLVVWAWLAVLVLSATQAGSLTQAAIKIVQNGLYFIAAYMVYCDLFASRRGVRQAIMVLAGATTVVVLWGLADYMYGAPIVASAIANGHPGPLAGILRHIPKGNHLLAMKPLEMMSTFGSHNIYSAYLAIVLPLLLALAVGASDVRQKVWLIGTVILGVATMLGGVAVVIVLATLLGLAICWPLKPRPTPVILGVFVVCVALCCALPRSRAALSDAFDPVERGELFRTGEMQGDIPANTIILKKRWIEWLPAAKMMTDHFMLGVGTGNYQLNIGRYYDFLPDAKKSSPDTANLYLVTGSSEGFASLVCLLAYLGMFWSQSRLIYRRARDNWGRALGLGLTAAISSLVVVNLFTSLLVRGTSLVWALLFAIVALCAKDGILDEEQ